MNKEISDRQLAILCFVSLLGFKLLGLPSLLFEDFSWGGIFVLLVFLILDLLIIICLLKIKKINNNLTFFEILQKYFPKFISYLLIFLFLMFFVFKLIYIFFEYHNYLSHSLSLELDKMTFVLMFFPVVNAIAYRGIKAFARTTEFFYVFLLFGLILILGLGVFSQEFFTLNPLENIGNFFSSIAKRSMWFGDGIFILLFIDSFELKKSTAKKVTYDVVLLSITTIIFFISYYVIYQSTSRINGYAISDVIQFSTKFGNVGKLDIFAVLVAIFMLIFQISIYFICAEKCTYKIVKNKYLSFGLLNILILTLIFGVFHNSITTSIFFVNIGKYLAWFISYIFPLLLLVLSISKSKRSKQ